MNNRDRVKLGVFMALAMAASGDDFGGVVGDRVKRDKPEFIPNGCRRYWFVDGDIVGEEFSEISEFSCIAMNEKVARKKYGKYLISKSK